MRLLTLATLTSLAALGFGAVEAGAQAPPHQRPGLWQTDMVQGGRPMQIKSCVDEASEARTSVFGASIRKTNNCQQQQLSHNPDGSWTSVSTCTIAGHARTSRVDISGDFSSKIKMSMRSPPSAPPEMTMTVTWIGPCGAGMRGGDVIMSNGMKMNVLGQ